MTCASRWVSCGMPLGVERPKGPGAGLSRLKRAATPKHSCYLGSSAWFRVQRAVNNHKETAPATCIQLQTHVLI